MYAFKDFCLAVEAVQDYLQSLFNRLRTDPKLQGDDLYFHFTSIPKLGVNPRPGHRDPYGIYMFPKRWVLSNELGRNHAFFTLPYIYVLRIRPGARLLRLDQMTREQGAEILARMGLGNLAPAMFHSDEELKGVVSYAPEATLQPGQIFWQILDHYLQPQRKNNGVWNALFRKAGIDGVVDGGTAAIHSNEPDQAIVFDPKNLEVVEFINNVSPARSQNNVARTVMTKFGDAVFGPGKYRFTTSRRNRIEWNYRVSGTYRDHPFVLSTTVGVWAGEELRMREMSLRIGIYADWHARSRVERKEIRVDVAYRPEDDHSIDAQVEQYAPYAMQYMDEVIAAGGGNRQDRSGKLAEIARRVFYYFGVKPPEVRPHQDQVEMTRQYDWGSFHINIGWSSYSNAWDAVMVLYAAGRGQRVSRNNLGDASIDSRVHGDGKHYPDDLEPGAIAEQMVRDMFAGLKHNIYKHYNPDPNAHSSDWGKWDAVSRGEKLLKVLYRLRAVPRVRLLLGDDEPSHEFEKGLQDQRKELDLRWIIGEFDRRFPKLAALKRRFRYDPFVENGIGQANENSAIIRVGETFLNLSKEEKFEKMAMLIVESLLRYDVGYDVASQHLGRPDKADARRFWFGFAEAFMRYFLYDDPPQDDAMLRAIQDTYMKGLAYA